MEKATLGNTGLEVTRLGVGLAEVGFELNFADEDRAGKVLNSALDAGINFLDTAACYDISEELLGRTVSHRRSEYYLATKAGHVTDGYQGQEWTYQTVAHSIDRSLVRMRTDHLDLVQLHTCEVDVLERGEVIRALQDARRAGKARFIGYSGDNEAALWAVESGLFDTLQTSFNLVDQRARLELFARARAKGMGIIAKRPIANSAWGAPRSPRSYADEYFRRAQALLAAGPIPGAPDDRIALALGFTLSHPEVNTAIVGSAKPEHMLANISLLKSGLRLAPEVVETLHQRFEQIGREWDQRS
jgi:aryl-alcohol dehydrogenase-like predicted oxidoreductase